jgi:hypothetical protein
MPERESVAVLAEYAVAKVRPREADIENLKQWFEWCFRKSGPAYERLGSFPNYISYLPMARVWGIPWTSLVREELLDDLREALYDAEDEIADRVTGSRDDCPF